MATKNHAHDPKVGAKGQSMAQSLGKGGANKPGMPFGMKAGSSRNADASPRHGVKGQRLASGGGKGATGYPPGYCGK